VISATVAISGHAALTAFGRGVDRVLPAAWAGEPGFGPVDRFDVAGRRVRVAAVFAGTAGTATDLRTELVTAIAAAAAQAGLTTAELADTPLILALHGDPELGRAAPGRAHRPSAATFATTVAAAAGLAAPLRTYTSACVAASTAVAGAAAVISRTASVSASAVSAGTVSAGTVSAGTGSAGTGSAGAVDRVVVAAGYLVGPDQFALFDAARTMSTDGRVRPFSLGRKGLLLGDGVAAVVLESPDALRRRGGEPLAWLRGWARTGDAYHVCQPRPDGAGLARAIDAALTRGRVAADDLGYVNAHGSGSPRGDTAEVAALHRALGPLARTVPVSSTKSVHGQALEASGLIELVVTVEALRHGRLPVNAGYLEPDLDCRLNVVASPRETRSRYALSLNAAFGGANTALLVGAA
jgi:3-oxoacyl-[acyl-carrier-protein] synthase II